MKHRTADMLEVALVVGSHANELLNHLIHQDSREVRQLMSWIKRDISWLEGEVEKIERHEQDKETSDGDD